MVNSPKIVVKNFRKRKRICRFKVSDCQWIILKWLGTFSLQRVNFLCDFGKMTHSEYKSEWHRNDDGNNSNIPGNNGVNDDNVNNDSLHLRHYYYRNFERNIHSPGNAFFPEPNRVVSTVNRMNVIDKLAVKSAEATRFERSRSEVTLRMKLTEATTAEGMLLANLVSLRQGQYSTAARTMAIYRVCIYVYRFKLTVSNIWPTADCITA